MRRPKPAEIPPEPGTPAASRAAIALGALALAAAAIASSLRPTAGNWGLHAAGFLDPPVRYLLLAATVAAAAVAAWGLFAEPDERGAARRPSRRRRRDAALPWLLVAGWLAFGLATPVKESLLGDSAVWLQNVQADTLSLRSEPLSARILDLVADARRAEGTALDPATLGLASRAAGAVAGVLLLAIAFEIRGTASLLAVLALLLTTGTSQYYHGYVETYPIALLFVLLYAWLGLRAARGAAPIAAAGIALGLAAAAHVTALLLFPSYVYVALRGGRRARGALAAAVPLGVVAVAFAALGYGIENLAHPFRVATQGVAPAGMHDVFLRPYAFFSWAHVGDVVHAALLAAPVALLLLLGGGIALARRSAEAAPPPTAPPRAPVTAPAIFLAIAAAPGIAVAASLMTPVAPAQDWDLFAFLLAPAAIAGIATVATTTPRVLRGPAAAGLVALSATLLLPFVLVNADSRASVARFGVVVSDPTRISPYGRSYGNEILWVLHRDRREGEQALAHARAAYDAEPTNPRHAINLGHALLALRRVEEAIPHFQAATAAAPRRWDAPFDLGLSYASLRRYPEALDAFEEAARRDPDRPEIWVAVVRALFNAGRQDSAEAVWERVKARWPEYVEEQRRKHGGG